VQRLIIERQPQATEEKPKKQRSPGLLATMNVSGTELSDIKLESFTIGASRRSQESSESKESSEIEIVFTKLQDSASATLHKAAMQGLEIETARFEFLREGSDGNIETVNTLEFVRGHVSGFSLGGGDPPVEMVQVTFETRG
jgi:type VI protein secretion system component Hcp